MPWCPTALTGGHELRNPGCEMSGSVDDTKPERVLLARVVDKERAGSRRDVEERTMAASPFVEPLAECQAGGDCGRCVCARVFRDERE